MQKRHVYASLPAVIAVLAIFATSSTGMVYAQEEIPEELPISIATSDLVIIGLGVLGGLTVAFLGKSEATKEANYKFEATKFARPIVVAVLTSVPLAIAASLEYAELNLVTMFLIYAATLGMAELSGRIKKH